MAYVLKSDAVVSDPEGRFPYYTRYGITHAELAAYMKQVDATGYEMPEAHFTAFHSFIQTLKDGGLWPLVKEVYPLYGKTVAAAGIKLKSGLAAANLAPVNGLALSHFEKDGSGLIIGTANRTYVDSNSPCFDTGFDVEALTPSWAFSAYHDASGIAYNASFLSRAMFGAYLDVGSSSQAVAELRFSSATDRILRVMNSNPGISSAILGAGEDKGLATFVATPTKGKIYAGTTVKGDSAFAFGSGVNRARRAWLFGKNPAGAGGTITGGYNGRMRFAMVLGDGIGDTNIAELNTAVTTLMTALGKQFA